MSYYSKPLSADVGSIQIFCRIRLTENLRWINKWVLIEIINTNRNKEKVMRSLFLASTSWLENVCYLAKEIINAKIVWKWKMLMFTTKWKMLMFTTIFSYQRHMSRWQLTSLVHARQWKGGVVKQKNARILFEEKKYYKKVSLFEEKLFKYIS